MVEHVDVQMRAVQQLVADHGVEHDVALERFSVRAQPPQADEETQEGQRSSNTPRARAEGTRRRCTGGEFRVHHDSAGTLARCPMVVKAGVPCEVGGRGIRCDRDEAIRPDLAVVPVIL